MLGNDRVGVTQVIFKNRCLAEIFACDSGMLSLEQYLDDRLAHGRSYFSREEALSALDNCSAKFRSGCDEADQ